jgi:hypothetical protein
METSKRKTECQLSKPTVVSITVTANWYVSVTVFQILPKGVLFLLSEAGAAKQAEGEREEEAAVDPSLSQSLSRAAVHMYDCRAVRTAARAGPALQR